VLAAALRSGRRSGRLDRLQGNGHALARVREEPDALGGELGGLGGVEADESGERQEQGQPQAAQGVVVGLRPGQRRRRHEAGGSHRRRPSLLDV
jgi:hypothetical protein